jgi:hypothetical protein
MRNEWFAEVILDKKQSISCMKTVFTTLIERGRSKKSAAEETVELTKTPDSTVWRIISNSVVERKQRTDIAQKQTILMKM